MKLFDITGRVAVVSGAAQGLGRATALAVAEAGSDVMLVDRNLEGAEATAEQIRLMGRKALAANTNVSEPDAIRELFLQVDAEFGRVDFLGNIAGDGHLAKPEDLTIEDLRETHPGPLAGIDNQRSPRRCPGPGSQGLTRRRGRRGGWWILSG